MAVYMYVIFELCYLKELFMLSARIFMKLDTQTESYTFKKGSS